MIPVDVLLPTCNRLTSLVFTLSGLAGQTLSAMRVIVSDQSARAAGGEPVVKTLCRVIEARGGEVEWHTRGPVHGIAEQRQFLLDQSRAGAVLYLDDDVFMEPPVLERMLGVLREQSCAFVGAFPNGVSHRMDVRSQQQVVEFWENGRVKPEAVDPGTPGWERWNLHRAANLYHASRRLLRPGEYRLYKVAWIASCILYDRGKLTGAGGFSFWNRLPRYHSGEEVLVQNLLMRRWGGCAIMPSETWYSEVPSTVLNEKGTVDGHALDLLPDMIRRTAPDATTGAPA